METAGERIWDYTTLSTYLSCAKKYEYRMLKHLVPTRTAPALLFGKAMHRALEEYYKELQQGARAVYEGFATDKAVAAFNENFEDMDGEEKRTRYNAEKMIRGYNEVYRNEPFTIKGIEVGFTVPVYYGPEDMTRSFLLCGRLDALVDWNGALYVLEHKTTSVLGASYFYQFEMNMQVDGYIYGAEQLTGKKCMGAIINAIEVWKDVAKPTAKTKGLSDHYARDPQSRSEYQMREYCNDAGIIVEQIVEAEKTNCFPRNKQSCFSYNYKCPYWELCKYGEDERLMAKDFKQEKWEPYKQEGGE